MKILVTGANGMLAKEVKEKFDIELKQEQELFNFD